MKRLLAAIALSLLALPALGASLGYQQSTSLSTSSAISPPTIPFGASSMTMDIEGAAIRLRDDGTDPTSSVGRPMAAGSSMCYTNDPHGVRVIGQTAGATVNWTYLAGKCQ